MTASQSRVLMTDLVAEANDFALLDDYIRVGDFRRAGLLMDYTTSDNDDDIKHQCVITKKSFLINIHALKLTLSLVFFLLQNHFHLKMNTILIQMMLICTLMELVMTKTQKMISL